MKNKTWKVILTVFLGLSCFSAQAQVPTGGAVAIVGASNPVTSLNSKLVTELFWGKKKFWDGNVRVKLFLGKAGSESSSALKAVTGRGVEFYHTHLANRGLAGRGTLPKSFATAAEAAEKISRSPSGIAVIGAAQAEALSIIDGEGFKLIPIAR